MTPEQLARYTLDTFALGGVTWVILVGLAFGAGVACGRISKEGK